MNIKSFFIYCAAAAVALTSAAFELGRDDAVIYHSKVNKLAANEMSVLLNKVFGKKYTVKQGEVFFSLPDELHDTGALPEEKSEIFFLIVNLELSKKLPVFCTEEERCIK